MDTKNFILELTDAVQRLLGNDYSVSTNDVIKNGGLILTGLIIRRKDQNLCLTIYINQFFELYKAGAPMDAIAEEIVRQYREQDTSFPFDVSAITDYKKVKGTIIFQLVNTERNAALLETVPFVKFLDFSIIFKIYFVDFPPGSATATVTNRLMELWNVSVETIYQDALLNTPALQECSLKGMVETLVEHGVNVDDDEMARITESDKLYILSNKQHSCGCGCILYPHVLEEFAEKIGMGFYILPSSRHEVLLAPEQGKDADVLEWIVRTVNTQIEQEDFLSDNVYHYSKETREITIIQYNFSESQ